MSPEFVVGDVLQRLLVDRSQRAPANLAVQRNMESLALACRPKPPKLDMAAALTGDLEPKPAEDANDILPAERPQLTRHGSVAPAR